MTQFRNGADLLAIEAEGEWQSLDVARTMHGFLRRTAAAHGGKAAVSYQLTSGPGDKAQTLTWDQLLSEVTRAANLFRSLGVGPGDTVAYILPNALETVVTLLGGMVAGIVAPINPLLEPEQIAGLLRETRAKVVVTLRSFPQTDVAQKVAKALEEAPGVKTVLEVDLAHYLPFAKGLIAGLFLRPKQSVAHGARVMDFARALAAQSATLGFADPEEDRVAAYFHTGGTTGMPKVAQHRVSGMVYNGWLGGRLLFKPSDVLMCPLPLFHVFAAYPILMSVIASGAQVVFPTPQGYRGAGVFDNLWKLVERWGVTYLIAVPTALAALMQRPVDAKISTLRGTFSGSSPLPIELFQRYQKTTGVQIIEGYGLTEATCLVAVNPPEGEKRIGSVGFAFPHTKVRIVGPQGQDCAVDEIGEICISNPGVIPGGTYLEPSRNEGLFHGDFLRTGDLGRIDPQGYLYITGRAKDLIIRGGHNIDPGLIEEALAGHPAVALAGAIGQPDSFAGELPCVYVELVQGASATPEALLEHCRAHITERAAIPKHVEILPALPKTAVGKILKNELRKAAIARVYDAALAEAGISARVSEVVEDRKRGLVARVAGEGDAGAVLGAFATPWEPAP
ncbi:acyl-CoA synthetase [Stagnihabitans tardus]|uniref:Acyl-CoA synthetase n=1 Tax=Stagnihabitans tardus TaxID=2699202 RepID=A0AAE4YB01_9RHOB|nr:acyl-CoA synthetase [Stagnihabitans tardus]NBZ88367.1 acyl-CoA synthetase [Stagnihabitans tardus]